MKQTEILTSKTARYFTLGTYSPATKEVWIVLHGYGQLANYFLDKFKGFESESRHIVAPEGLHRFYWKGFSGRVVASWMTKEERETDINDYVHFLDKVANQFPCAEINVLGFSQGAATACRFVALGKTKVNKLVLWGGAFPGDIDYFEKKSLFNSNKMKLVLGTEDEYYTEELIEKELKRLRGLELEFEVIRYEGGHNIYKEGLENALSNS